MARTYRYKNVVPHSVVGRDDGYFYSPEVPDQKAHRRVKDLWKLTGGEYPRVAPKWMERRWMRHEDKYHRKEWYRRHRHHSNFLTRFERDEEIERYTRTGGWSTW